MVLFLGTAIALATEGLCEKQDKQPCPSSVSPEGGKNCSLISGTTFPVGTPVNTGETGYDDGASDNTQHCEYNCDGTNKWYYYGLLFNQNTGNQCTGQ
jgi:hypothetical protein